jgi:hypothetical protein
MSDPPRRGFAFVAGYDDVQKAGAYLRGTLDLSGQAERVRSKETGKGSMLTASRDPSPGSLTPPHFLPC